jgi:hypothetical protein
MTKEFWIAAATGKLDKSLFMRENARSVHKVTDFDDRHFIALPVQSLCFEPASLGKL